ncbi:patatin family protein [Dictyostelium discoideum AX4]|uniref:Patatin family protein n=1 Tax=Dictyostelium discoideum TaxID=44689 RepID=Q55G69_DICDI|nr:patatin family protein [Dictyostelium discoideum AX4]EAL73626.1 patatin family protein [Dictyostelium discoideum AX4]|eukprot:XP_647314.1 patatin family protein [Dictyostelium discoideum AX4]
MDWIKSYFNYYFKREVVVKNSNGDSSKIEDYVVDQFTILNNNVEDGNNNNILNSNDDGGGIKIIVSFDGGGMRGIVSILLLKEIQNILGFDIGVNCDIVCGTSTGGIVTYAKLFSVDNDELLRLYCEFGKKIFPSSSMGIMYNVYEESTLCSTKELISTLETNFQGKIMSDRKGFVVTVAQDKISAEKSVKIFANYQNPSTNLHDDDSTSVVDIIRSTAGIPGLFHLYENDKYIYYDGGFQYNCNLPIALIEASSLYPNASKLLFISIGTGYGKNDSPNYYCSNDSTDDRVEEYLKQFQDQSSIGGIKLKSSQQASPTKLGGIYDLIKNLYNLYRNYVNMTDTYVVLQQFLKDHQLDDHIFTYRFDVQLEYDISLRDSSLQAEQEMQRSVYDYVNSNTSFKRSVSNIKKLIELNNNNNNKQL